MDLLDTGNAQWWKVSYGGTIGFVMAEFLTRLMGTATGIRVVLPCTTKVEAEKLVSQLRAAQVEG